MEEAASIGLNVRRLRFLRPAPGKKPSLFLVEFGGEGGVELEEAVLT